LNIFIVFGFMRLHRHRATGAHGALHSAPSWVVLICLLAAMPLLSASAPAQVDARSPKGQPGPGGQGGPAGPGNQNGQGGQGGLASDGTTPSTPMATSASSLPCPTIPRGDKNSGIAQFDAYLSTDIEQIHTDPVAWAQMGSTILAALGLTSTAQSNVVFVEISTYCTKVTISVYNNQVDCLTRNLATGQLYISWNTNIYYFLSQNPHTTPTSTTVATTTITTTASAKWTSKKASTKKTTTTTTTAPAAADISTTDEDMAYSYPSWPPFGGPGGDDGGFSDFNNASAPCDIMTGDIARLMVWTPVPAALWQGQLAAQSLLIAATLLSLGVSNLSVSAVTLDQMYTATNITDNTLTLIGLTLTSGASQCIKERANNASLMGGLGILYQSQLYAVNINAAIAPVEMKFEIDFDQVLPTALASVQWTETVISTLVQRGIARSKILYIGLRRGSIDVTVCLNSQTAATTLVTDVTHGDIVMQFNNWTSTAALISYASSTPSAGGSSPSALSTGAIAGIVVSALALAVLVIAVLTKMVQGHKGAATLETGSLQWDSADMDISDPLPLHMAVSTKDASALQRAIEFYKTLRSKGTSEARTPRKYRVAGV